MLQFMAKNGKKIIILFIICMVALCFEMPQTAEAADTPYAANGQLSISGGKVVNSKGDPFVIKGVSTHGLAWYPEYVNEKSFKTLRDKFDVNTIRLAMYTAEYNGYCTGGSKKDLEKLIDDGVKYAEKLGMYLIIDWHILSDGNPKTYQKQSKAFFKKMAKKYADCDNVMYEICNEPNGSEGSWKNIKSYAYGVIKTIRAYDEDAIIIVGTPTWSQDIENAVDNPIKGYDNIAYSFHFYAGTHKGAMRTRLRNALKKKVPVIVTEFGISDASGNGSVNTAGGKKWMELLDKYQTGRVCWNLSNKSESSAIIKSSCKKVSGWTSTNLTSTGKFLLKSYTGKTTVSSSTTGGTATGATASSSTTGGTATGATASSITGSATSNSITSTESSEIGSSTTAAGTTANDETANDETAKAAVTAVTNGSETEALKGSVTVSKANSWKQGGSYYTQYKITIKNTGDRTIKNWSATVTLKEGYKITDSWCANFKRSQRTTTVTPLSWNKKISKNESVEVGFVVRSDDPQKVSSKKVTFA